VTAVGSAAEALDAMDRGVPDVVICDIGMPVEDGYALLEKVRLRGADRGGDVPVIALTAYATREDRDRALAAGFQQHVAKPVDAEALVNGVAAVLRDGGWRRPAEVRRPAPLG
jgi:CheY-like chemotaxis protein